jgi:hypothetical protein
MKDKENDLNAAEVRRSTPTGSPRQRHQVHPGWVKIVVAIALGLGTMVGWKRIVITVGSKIGKTHPPTRSSPVIAAATTAADGFGRCRPPTCSVRHGFSWRRTQVADVHRRNIALACVDPRPRW